jgi:TonB-dependent SusC/RagA subfamily outer membrane receptor
LYDGVVRTDLLADVSSQEVVATPGKPMSIILKVDNNLLDEVIVTGYGTFKKSAYAGSASIVKTDAVKDVPNVSFQQMLEGAAPGVSVNTGSGIPGSSTSIRIRGMGSFNASNSPLYVVDGIPVLSGNIGASGSDSGLDVMSTLNTSDIESITVIKDAAAASLYGSRAANGVVIITTKQGKAGKPVFKLKSDWGFSNFAMPFRELMGGQERRNLIGIEIGFRFAGDTQ